MRIGERIRWARGYDTFGNQVKRAENAINYLQEIELKEWFIELLNILKNNQCARVVGNNSKQLDVTKIAHTYSYTSFFDVLNNKHLFDINIKPICIEEKPNKTISKFYGHNDYV